MYTSSFADGVDATPATAVLTLASSKISALSSVASRCDGVLISRLDAFTLDAVSHITASVSALSDAVHQCVPAFVSNVRRRARTADKLLEMTLEEFDAALKTLAAFMQQCALGDFRLEFTQDTMDALRRILRGDAFCPVSVVLGPSSANAATQGTLESSCIVLGIDSARTKVSCPPWLTRGEGNTIRVTVFDTVGEPVRGITPVDVLCALDHECVGWSVESVCVEANTVTLLLAVALECSDAARLDVRIWDVTTSIPLKV